MCFFFPEFNPISPCSGLLQRHNSGLFFVYLQNAGAFLCYESVHKKVYESLRIKVTTYRCSGEIKNL